MTYAGCKKQRSTGRHKYVISRTMPTEDVTGLLQEALDNSAPINQCRTMSTPALGSLAPNAMVSTMSSFTMRDLLDSRHIKKMTYSRLLTYENEGAARQSVHQACLIGKSEIQMCILFLICLLSQIEIFLTFLLEHFVYQDLISIHCTILSALLHFFNQHYLPILPLP